MTNLILGTVKNYNYAQIRPFLDSLSAVNYAGEVVLLVSDISRKTASKLLERGIKLVYFTDYYPFLSDYNEVLSELGLPAKYDLPLSLCTMRFVMYYLYLSRLDGKYNRVMLTDVRDVIFQKDPFAFNDNNQLSVFLEDDKHRIADCPHNSKWIKQSFEEGVSEQIKNKNISCNGIIIGPTGSLLDYLKKMMDLIFRVGPPGIVGQGFHNYLIHTGKLPGANIFSNESGPVLTLGLMSGYCQNEAGELLNQAGLVPNIIHQYDRHPKLARRYYSRTAIWRGKRNDFKHWILRPLKKFPHLYYRLKIIYHHLWKK